MKKRLAREPEERLVAAIISSTQSYYLSQHDDGAPINDEAITTLQCEITEIDDRHRQHAGEAIDLALVCSRRFCDDKVPQPGRPLLLHLNLRKNQRSLLSYIPEDAYWALPTMLTRPADPCIELAFDRLHRGSGSLRSLWIGSYAELRAQRDLIAGLTRGE